MDLGELGRRLGLLPNAMVKYSEAQLEQQDNDDHKADQLVCGSEFLRLKVITLAGNTEQAQRQDDSPYCTAWRCECQYQIQPG